MAYRALAAGIILFWLGMTALLLRSELFPDGASQRPVPPAHVFKQMFLHEEPSDLALYRHKQRMGVFHVQPRRSASAAASGATHTLNLNGGAMLDALGFPNQRIVLRATFELDDQQAVRRFEVSATVREPRRKGTDDASVGIHLDGAPPDNRYHYLIRRGEVVQAEASGTPEQLLEHPFLQGLGFDPKVLATQAFSQAAGAARVEARRSTLPLNGDRVETYLVTIHHGDTLESTLQTTPQGQILTVTTFAGYDLYDETLAP